MTYTSFDMRFRVQFAVSEPHRKPGMIAHHPNIRVGSIKLPSTVRFFLTLTDALFTIGVWHW